MQGQIGKKRAEYRLRSILAGIVILVVTMVLALFSGDTPITPVSLFRAMGNRGLPGAGGILAIVFRIRVPRIVLAAVAGASLGTAGALMQGVLGNPLASPFTLGISSAAGFGASLAIVAGRSILSDEFAIVGNAFVFAMAASMVVYALAAMFKASPLIIVLAGMGMNFLFSSLTTLLHYFSAPEAVYRALFWTSGSLSLSSWPTIAFMGVIFIIFFLLSTGLLYDLSLVIEGESSAAMVGVDVRRTRLSALLFAAIMAASTVSFVGVIGFIGLVAPHLCRMLGMGDPRGLIPLSAITGALLLVLADIAATRLAAPVILPIGAVTSLLGVLFLSLLILFNRKSLWNPD